MCCMIAIVDLWRGHGHRMSMLVVKNVTRLSEYEEFHESTMCSIRAIVNISSADEHACMNVVYAGLATGNFSSEFYHCVIRFAHMACDVHHLLCCAMRATSRTTIFL